MMCLQKGALQTDKNQTSHRYKIDLKMRVLQKQQVGTEHRLNLLTVQSDPFPVYPLFFLRWVALSSPQKRAVDQNT